MMKEFGEFKKALSWAKVYARESCLACHYWKVESIGRRVFAVAIRSKVSHELIGYAY